MANQNHLRNKGMQMSYLEERILDALFMLTLVDMRGRGINDYNRYIHFKGRAISEVIGGGWTTFRKRLMQQIKAHGWIEIIPHKEGYFYALTDTGYNTLNARVAAATKQAIEVWHEQDEDGEQIELWSKVEI